MTVPDDASTRRFAVRRVRMGAALLALAIAWNTLRQSQTEKPAPKNPLQFRSAIEMAVMFQVVLFAVFYLRQQIGEAGLMAGGFVLGLTDVDALTLSMTRSVQAGTSIGAATRAIATGIVANSLLKAAIAGVIGHSRFKWQAGLSLIAMAAAGSAAASDAEPVAPAQGASASVGAVHEQSRSSALAAVSGTPRDIAQVLAAEKGWTGSQWTCLDKLWNHESKYETTVRNSRSGAYGIPQALPASKMASAGADWRTNPVTQIVWGLGYIGARYGTPCGAWTYWVHHSSY